MITAGVAVTLPTTARTSSASSLLLSHICHVGPKGREQWGQERLSLGGLVDLYEWEGTQVP